MLLTIVRFTFYQIPYCEVRNARVGGRYRTRLARLRDITTGLRDVCSSKSFASRLFLLFFKNSEILFFILQSEANATLYSLGLLTRHIYLSHDLFSSFRAASRINSIHGKCIQRLASVEIDDVSEEIAGNADIAFPDP